MTIKIKTHLKFHLLLHNQCTPLLQLPDIMSTSTLNFSPSMNQISGHCNMYFLTHLKITLVGIKMFIIPVISQQNVCK